MQADMISPIARWYLIAIGDEEQMWLRGEVVVTRMQEDGKAAGAAHYVRSGDGCTIST